MFTRIYNLPIATTHPGSVIARMVVRIFSVTCSVLKDTRVSLKAVNLFETKHTPVQHLHGMCPLNYYIIYHSVATAHPGSVIARMIIMMIGVAGSVLTNTRIGLEAVHLIEYIIMLVVVTNHYSSLQV